MSMFNRRRRESRYQWVLRMLDGARLQVWRWQDALDPDLQPTSEGDS